MKKPPSSARVVIVGGGYGGIAAAKALDPGFDVTLIERRDAFFHNIAALRSVVDPRWTDALFVPLGDLLRRGHVRQGFAVRVHIEGREVALESGTRVGYDYLVLATGSSYRFPGKASHSGMAEAVGRYREVAGNVRRAESALVVGGGPVGIELAGEIAHRYPEKQVTLAHNGKRLLGRAFRPKLSRKLLRALRGLGVDVLLGERVDLEDVAPAGELRRGQTLRTQSGQVARADVCFVCVGARPNTAWLEGSPLPVTSGGRVSVNGHLQVRGHQRVFALGDVTDVEEPKMAYTAETHASVIGANVEKLEAAADSDASPDLETHEASSKYIIVVPVGPEGGASQLPVLWKPVVGGWATKRIKSRGLFVERYWRKLGAEPPELRFSEAPTVKQAADRQ